MNDSLIGASPTFTTAINSPCKDRCLRLTPTVQLKSSLMPTWPPLHILPSPLPHMQDEKNGFMSFLASLGFQAAVAHCPIDHEGCADSDGRRNVH